MLKRLYTTLLYIIIVQVFLLGQASIINAKVLIQDRYVYKTSYEGFAGYCTVITNQLKDTSQKMTNRHKIRTLPKHKINTNIYTSPQKHPQRKNQARTASHLHQKKFTEFTTLIDKSRRNQTKRNRMRSFATVVSDISKAPPTTKTAFHSL